MPALATGWVAWTTTLMIEDWAHSLAALAAQRVMGLLPMPKVVWRILVDPRRVPPAHGGCVAQAIHHWNWVASSGVPVPSSVTVAPCGLVASQSNWVLATLTVGGAAAAG